MPNILDWLNADNIAEKIDDELLSRIGARVVEEFRIDKESRSEWEASQAEGLKLARLLREERRYAGDLISSVKYPNISIAAMQFAARAYPSIVRGADVVKCLVTGLDDDGSKTARGERVRKHMNYQILNRMPNWESDMDQLLVTLPVTGCVFKKTYFNVLLNCPVSEMVAADDLVVNYWTKCTGAPVRQTQIVRLYPNEIVERINAGLFLDVEYSSPSIELDRGDDMRDEDAPHVFLEQHRWLDMDDDGYAEPYVVTVHRDTERVVRIVPRYDVDGIVFDSNGGIARIEPVEYFTKFIFMPAFDGNYYGLGFGELLAPINETINTLINQLIDSGTLANRQGGFLARGMQMLSRGETVRFKPGEWKYVQSTGDDLRKSIVPIPVHEPSGTLFQMLSLMIDSGKELSSTAEILTGADPMSHEPATTTLARIEQGLKVFSAIYKRVYRGLKSELEKIRRLNRLYLSVEEYNTVLDEREVFHPASDYESSDYDLCPVSAGAEITDTQRIIRANALMELTGRGLDDREILRRYLEALEIPDWERLFPQSPPEPDPELVLKEKELEIKARKQESDEEKAGAQAMKLRTDALTNIEELRKPAESIKELMIRIGELSAIIDKQQAMLDRMGVLNDGGNIGDGVRPLENASGYDGGFPVGEGESEAVEGIPGGGAYAPGDGGTDAVGDESYSGENRGVGAAIEPEMGGEGR